MTTKIAKSACIKLTDSHKVRVTSEVRQRVNSCIVVMARGDYVPRRGMRKELIARLKDLLKEMPGHFSDPSKTVLANVEQDMLRYA